MRLTNTVADRGKTVLNEDKKVSENPKTKLHNTVNLDHKNKITKTKTFCFKQEVDTLMKRNTSQSKHKNVQNTIDRRNKSQTERMKCLEEQKKVWRKMNSLLLLHGVQGAHCSGRKRLRESSSSASVSSLPFPTATLSPRLTFSWRADNRPNEPTTDILSQMAINSAESLCM